MKSVMLSIRPKWCEKIACGEKTIEVRKTKPKLETPFKCYIYCTQSGVALGAWGKHGKVIGEFTCDRMASMTLMMIMYYRLVLKMEHYGIMGTEHRFTAGISPTCAFMTSRGN